MNRFLRPAVAAALLALAGLVNVGCIKGKDDVTVTKDGSGTFVTTVTMDLSAMKKLAESFGGGLGEGAGMGEEKPGEAEKDPLEELKEEWKGIEGLEIVKATKEEKDGKFTMTVEAKFKTLEAYAKASKNELNGSLVKNKDGSYTLKFTGEKEAPAAEGVAPEEAAKQADEAAAMAAQMMGMFEPFLKDLEMTRTLKLPGTVVETNGTKSEDGTSVSWELTWADVKTGKPPVQNVTFKGDGIDIKPFVVAREPKGPGGK